jgi:hypothetical protein
MREHNMTTTVSVEYSSAAAWRDAAKARGLSIITDPTGDNGKPVARAYYMRDGKPVVCGKLRRIGLNGQSGVQGWLQETRD